MNTAPIDNPSLNIRPSVDIIQYIKNLKDVSDSPEGIQAIHSGKKDKDVKSVRKSYEHKLLTTKNDREYIETLKPEENSSKTSTKTTSSVEQSSDVLLNMEDIYWLYENITEKNKSDSEKTYFHELFKGSEIILPKNVEIPRSEELEKRCQRLKAEQENREYNSMTKNVDNMRRKLPEDTIAYQCKETMLWQS